MSWIKSDEAISVYLKIIDLLKKHMIENIFNQ